MQVAQLRLADQHQLDQLVLVGVDVGEHPELLERLGREVLRLVEDQHGAPAGGVFLDQEVLELGEELHVAGVGLGRHPERHQHPVQELAAVALGVGDQPDGEVLGQAPEQVAQQRGLAGADLAGDHRDRRMRQHAVLEHRVGAGVVLRPVEEVGVGQERERPLGQPEVLVVDRQRTRHTHPTPTRPPAGSYARDIHSAPRKISVSPPPPSLIQASGPHIIPKFVARCRQRSASSPIPRQASAACRRGPPAVRRPGACPGAAGIARGCRFARLAGGLSRQPARSFAPATTGCNGPRINDAIKRS